MKSFTQSLKSLLLALILVGGVSAASAANTWTAPTVAAPNGNVDAPINVSPVTQFKKGGIVIEGLNASNEILAFPFSVLNGNVGIGTSTPRGKLSVMGTAFANDFCIHDVNGNSTGTCLSSGTGGSSSGSVRNSGNLTIPSTDGTSLTWNHGFGAKPDYVRIVLVSLVNQSAAQGSYLAGDEIEVSTSVAVPSGVNYVSVPAYTTATQVVLNHQWASYPLSIAANRQGAYNTAVSPDKTTWALKIYAGLGAVSGAPAVSTSGVSQIIAGSGVTVSPTTGTGAVTVSASGGNSYTTLPSGFPEKIYCPTVAYWGTTALLNPLQSDVVLTYAGRGATFGLVDTVVYRGAYDVGASPYTGGNVSNIPAAVYYNPTTGARVLGTPKRWAQNVGPYADFTCGPANIASVARP